MQENPIESHYALLCTVAERVCNVNPIGVPICHLPTLDDDIYLFVSFVLMAARHYHKTFDNAKHPFKYAEAYCLADLWGYEMIIAMHPEGALTTIRNAMSFWDQFKVVTMTDLQLYRKYIMDHKNVIA